MQRNIGRLAVLAAMFLLTLAPVHVRAESMKADWKDPDYVKMMREREEDPEVMTEFGIEAEDAAGNDASSSDEQSEDSGETLDASGAALVDPYTGATYEHGDKLEGAELLYGVDVSKWQGTVDWTSAASTGISFAIIRLGYSYTSNGAHNQDPYYETNLAGAEAAGLKVGVYYFSQARTEEEARSEAEYVLGILGNTPLDLPVFFDYESTKGYYNYGLTKSQGTAVCQAFCDVIRAAGYRTGVYAGYDYIVNGLYSQQLEGDNVLWIARYNTVLFKSDFTGYIPDYSMWQYAASDVGTYRGQIAGIGYSDLSCWYWHGEDLSSFRNVTAQTAVTLPDPEMGTVTNTRTGVKVTWSKVDGCSLYRVFRKTGSGAYEPVKDTTAASWTDTSVVSGEDYTYTVCSLPEGGTAEPAEQADSRSIRYLGAITAEDVTLSNQLYGLRVSWKEVSGATSYRVYRKSDGGSYVRQTEIPAEDALTWTDTAAVSGTEYTYAVRAVSGSVLGSYEGTSILCLGAVRDTDLSLYSVAGGLKVRWIEVSGAEGYRVYRKLPGGSYRRIADIEGGSTVSWIDSSAVSGTTYGYCVRAVSGGTLGGYRGSSVYYLKAIAAADLNLANSTAGMLVRWPVIAGAEGYRVYRKTEGTGFVRLTELTGGDISRWTDTTAKNGVTYIYAVRALKGDVLGGYTAQSHLRLTGVSSLSLATAGTGKVKVSFSPANKESDGYAIQVCTDRKFSTGVKNLKITSNSVLTRTVTGLTVGTRVYVRVRCRKVIGDKVTCSAWSTVKSITVK